MSTAAVQATGLVKKFGDVLAVDGVDLQIPAGTVFGVLGPNGAGKTTTMRMLATLLRIDGGEASIFGVDVQREPHRVRQLIGVTGQYASVDEKLTARENLRLFARLQGRSARQATTIADDLLSRFDLTDAADRTLAKFSGGMRRRLDLASSLITSPPLIFLDEPTTGLDPRTRGQMWDTIRELVSAGATILLTTQYLDEADQLADRIAVIDRGQKVAEGTAGELKAQIGNSTLTLTLSDPNRLEEAARVLAKVVTRPAAKSPEAARLTVPLEQADEAGDALIALRQSGISVSGVQVEQPSLDEVFLALTGQAPASEDPEPAETTMQESR
ncbi:ATP-binding cassette domain-containing protein [Dermacoccaceae bacterium W4C1]